MTPQFILRIKERQIKKSVSAEREKIHSLERENARLMDEVTRYANVNNRLWGAMKYLPGGLEAARKITL